MVLVFLESVLLLIIPMVSEFLKSRTICIFCVDVCTTGQCNRMPAAILSRVVVVVVEDDDDAAAVSTM